MGLRPLASAVSPRAARNSWHPGSLHSCTLMDTWMGSREKSCSFSPVCSCTRTWWSCGGKRQQRLRDAINVTQTSAAHPPQGNVNHILLHNPCGPIGPSVRATEPF